MNGDGARNTLLLRLAGPMQAWGTWSRYTDRDTGYEPSKSGVIGLFCAAQGRRRHEEVPGALCRLRMGVRVDRQGVASVDYQTAGGWHRRIDHGYGVVQADSEGRRTVLSNRHYLADADFLVGLESGDDERELLRELEEALRWPRWPLFLGRKSYVPGRPVALAEQEGGGLRLATCLEAALRTQAPWPGRGCAVQFIIEQSDPAGAERRNDQPDEGAVFEHRRFLPRNVRRWFLRADERFPCEEA